MQRLASTVAFTAFVFLMQLLVCANSAIAGPDGPYFDIGTPTLREIWVDAAAGSDDNDGRTRESALRTVKAAWNRIPAGETLVETGYLIKLAAGIYDENSVPRYLASRYGTAQHPVILQSADGPGAVEITLLLNIFDCRYLYLLDLKIAPEPAETAIHLDRCDHVLMRNAVLDGKGEASQVLKVNHCDDIYVEKCDIFGAAGSTVDFVATRRGHITGNRIHDAGNWALLIKGGSAYFAVEANELFNARRGGVAAGQTTGFEFLQSPWLHYEAYDIKFVNNLVHDTGGAGMAVNGGFNILFAHNTLYRVGRDGSLIETLYGLRICSGNIARCEENLAAGGWGTTSTTDIQPLPNANLYVYNNLIYNPNDTGTRSAHFAIWGPQTPAEGTNIPSPAYLDRNLQIRGNVIWNHSHNNELGIEYNGVGCQDNNPTCNKARLLSENAINTFEPQLIDPANGNFHPVREGNLAGAIGYAIPDFNWEDAPAQPLAPAGNPHNQIPRDRDNNPRPALGAPGAYEVFVERTVISTKPKLVRVAPGRPLK